MAAYTTIDDPEAYFQTKAYTGDGTAIGSGGLAITLDGDTNMQPDLVWIKERNATDNHRLTDAVRGVTKEIYSDDESAAGTDSEGLTAFNSDGFTIGNSGGYNTNTNTYVAWCWKESATAGFDIVSYTGNGSARTISHSLSAVPKMIIVKNIVEAGGVSWQVYHGENTAAPETDY